MVSRVRDDVHSSLAVPGLSQLFDRVIAASRVHPIVVAIDEGDGNLECADAVYEGQTCVCTWR
jgi:hypothetical protein